MKLAARAVPPPQPHASRILVWDVPVRVLHWLMVLCFSGAYLTAEGLPWRALHATLGYSLAGLIVLRLLWGLVGSRYARFSDFVRGPAALAQYLASLRTRRPQPFIGHNPAGALAILGMLGLGLAVSASGWLALDSSADAAEELHELLANAMLGLVLLHVAGVALSCRLHRENLVAAMLHGRKRGQPGHGISHAYAWLGTLIVLALLAFWWRQYRGPLLPL